MTDDIHAYEVKAVYAWDAPRVTMGFFKTRELAERWVEHYKKQKLHLEDYKVHEVKMNIIDQAPPHPAGGDK